MNNIFSIYVLQLERKERKKQVQFLLKQLVREDRFSSYYILLLLNPREKFFVASLCVLCSNDLSTKYL